MNVIAYSLVVFTISLRVANMWSVDAGAPPWVRAVFGARAPVFVGGMVGSGVLLGAYSVLEGAWGHAFLNAYLALAVLAGARGSHGWFGPILRMVASRAFLAVAVVASGLAGLASDAPLAQAVNLLGAAVLISAFSAMTVGRWGARSAGSREYAILCLIADGLLLVSALLLGVWPLVLLEVYAVAADGARLLGRARAARHGNGVA